MKSIDILLIEDSPKDILVATEALQRAKVLNKLHIVTNGEEAMSFLHREGRFQTAPRPDLILLSLNLPRKSGREVHAEIKSNDVLKSIPLAVLAGSKAEEDMLAASGLQANCYITKPVEFSKFLQIVDGIENFSIEVMTLPPPGFVDLKAPPPVPVPTEGKQIQITAGSAIEPVRVLLIEDNPSEVILLRRALRDTSSSRFKITHTERLSEGIGKLQVERFDIILTDLALPDSHGLETFLKLQTEARDIPVIVLTSWDDEAIGIKALQSGAQDYLIKKDLNASLLVRSIRYAIERRQLEGQLRQWQRMEAVGQLAGGVAHDFNNLLTIVEGYASLMLGEGETSSPARKILNAALRAKALTRQLLAFGRKQVMQSKSVDLNEILAEIIKLLGPIVREDIHLQFHYAANLPLVHADAGMIEQIILNLVVNARDAMSEGGKLSISTSVDAIHQIPARRKPEVTPGQFVVITVRDTGTGIPAEMLPRIFEPFFTTKEVGKGTGLGLATVYGIVKQHRGWIDVQSELGKGTTFRIFLPVVKEENATRVTHAKGPETEMPRGLETILLAEDDPDLRLLVRTILDQHGYRVLEASQGTEALYLWSKHREAIDLLLTDMVMPDGVSGRDLAAKLRVEKPDLKVILTSGYSSEIFGGALILGYGEEFLQKPYAPDELLKVVRSTLDDKSGVSRN